jgi:hypothetical protein
MSEPTTDELKALIKRMTNEPVLGNPSRETLMRRVEELKASGTGQSAPSSAEAPQAAAEVKTLRDEVADLRRQLDDAHAELAARDEADVSPQSSTGEATGWIKITKTVTLDERNNKVKAGEVVEMPLAQCRTFVAKGIAAWDDPRPDVA